MFNLSVDFLRFVVAGAILAAAMATHSLSPEHASSVLASAGLYEEPWRCRCLA